MASRRVRPAPSPSPGDVTDPHPALLKRVAAPLEHLAAMHVLARVDEGHESAFMLARAARRAMLDTEQRRSLVLMVHDTLRRLNRLDDHIQRATGRPPTALGPAHRAFLRLCALFGEAREPLAPLEPWGAWHAGSPGARKASGPEARAVAKAAAAWRPRRDTLPERALAVGHPEWLVTLADRVLGAQADAFLAADNEEAPLALRANPLKASRDEVMGALDSEGVPTRPSAIAPMGIIAEEKAGIFRTETFKAGLFEVQDEGSQLIGALVDARPGQWVLDACAGAGGKTLQMGATMRGKGRLVVLDVHEAPLLELKRRAARAGVANYVSYVVDPVTGDVVGAKALRRGEARATTRLPREAYDRVLIDAPCSGLGTLRRTPELRWRQSPEKLATYPARQAVILDTWAPRVKLGGRVVYATCTIMPEENEDIVDAFLASHPGFRLVPAGPLLPPEAARAGVVDGRGFLRTFPHRHGTDGFFAAVLMRDPSDDAAPAS